MTRDANDFAPVAGTPISLAPGLALVLAPNASPMTFLGTNTYLLGHDNLAIIDPGPHDATHLDALIRAIDGRPVQEILVTHSHLDHSALSFALSAATGAPVSAFGDSKAGRSAIMTTLAKNGFAGGGEGIDTSFRPDVFIADDQRIGGDWGELRAIHTPGHIGNHLCFVWNDAIFTGDHIMGWASSLVSPPDGDLTDFMASCDKIGHFSPKVYYPGHGAPVHHPAARLKWLISHRKSRELQIISALRDQPTSVSALTKSIYSDTPEGLLPAAERNVFAHLIDLYQKGRLRTAGRLSDSAVFEHIGD